MKVDLTIPDPVAAPLTAQLTVTWDASYEAVDQAYRIEWGDGTTGAPAGGVNQVVHVYAKEGFYKVAVRSNDTSLTQSLKVGTPDFAAPGAAFKRGQKIIEEDTAAIFGTTSKLG